MQNTKYMSNIWRLSNSGVFLGQLHASEYNSCLGPIHGFHTAIYVQCIYLITINIHVEVDLSNWALIWGAWPTPLFGRLGGLMP